MITKPCPYCKSNYISASIDEKLWCYFAVCVECGAKGPNANTPTIAYLEWNYDYPKQIKQSERMEAK